MHSDTPLAQFADARRRPPCHRPRPGGADVSPRDKPAIFQLLALLEARYAVRVLWALRDGHAQTFRLLQDSVGGVTPNTLNTRIKELREAGLLTHGAEGYLLTPAGTDLVRRLGELPAFAHKWAARRPRRAPEPPVPPHGEDTDATPPAA
ncbi:hypothetical protein GCM10007320_32200 [Pseudorhodoferax aquiterrae]|uniref:HTH hxlR-type domain-containing protein n=1 Tax=Pseudorhodoferax aquiterrae TaxID=747304 RepID=A0ABQ3G3B1_9BURK|nr:hypothetical protein GCM10007320_32200 [Pseudorhodoferax aquiterrae]